MAKSFGACRERARAAIRLRRRCSIILTGWEDGMSVLCWLRGIALIPVVVAIAAGPSAGSAQVRFRAAVVYGDGIEAPLVLQEDTAVARCFWWFTYNFYASRATGTYDGGPAATISFLTPDEWQAAGDR